MPLKKPCSIIAQIHPTMGIKLIKIHQPDLFLSCHLFTLMAKAGQKSKQIKATGTRESLASFQNTNAPITSEMPQYQILDARP